MTDTRKLLRAFNSVTRSFIIPSPTVIVIQPTEGCDVGCHYCNRDWTSTDAMTLADTALVVEKSDELHIGYISITGGEPLTWEHIVASIAIFSRNHLASFMSSSGFSLDEEMVQGLGLADLDILNLSLDGITDLETSRKTLSQHDGEFVDRVLELRNRYGVSVMINSVISSEGVDQIPLLLDFTGKYNFPLSLSYQVPDFSECQTGIIQTPQIPREISQEIERVGKNGLLFGQLEYMRDPEFNYYQAKRRTIPLNPNMNVLFCHSSGGNLGIYLRDLNSRTYRDFLRSLKEHAEECNLSCPSRCTYLASYYKSHPISSTWALLKMLYPKRS